MGRKIESGETVGKHWKENSYHVYQAAYVTEQVEKCIGFSLDFIATISCDCAKK